MTGRVKMAASSGFGFIETAKKVDFFFHHSQLQDFSWKKLVAEHALGRTVIVEFDVDPVSDDGPRALNVKIVQVMNGDA
jgi:cold shock CspA family protein